MLDNQATSATIPPNHNVQRKTSSPPLPSTLSSHYQTHHVQPSNQRHHAHLLPSPLLIPEEESSGLGGPPGPRSGGTIGSRRRTNDRKKSKEVQEGGAEILMDQAIQTMDGQDERREFDGSGVGVISAGINLDLIDEVIRNYDTVDMPVFDNLFGVTLPSRSKLMLDMQRQRGMQIQRAPMVHRKQFEREKQNARMVGANTIVPQAKINHSLLNSDHDRVKIITPIASSRQFASNLGSMQPKNLPKLHGIGQSLMRNRASRKKSQLGAPLRHSVCASDLDPKPAAVPENVNRALSLLVNYGPTANSMKLTSTRQTKKKMVRGSWVKKSVDVTRGDKFGDFSLVNGYDQEADSESVPVIKEVDSSADHGREQVKTRGFGKYLKNNSDSQPDTAEGHRIAKMLKIDTVSPNAIAADQYEELQSSLFSPNFEVGTPSTHAVQLQGNSKKRKMTQSVLSKYQNQQQSSTTTDVLAQVSNPFTHSNLQTISLHHREKPELFPSLPTPGGPTPITQIQKKPNAQPAAQSKMQLQIGGQSLERKTGGRPPVKATEKDAIALSAKAARYAAGKAAKVRKRGKLVEDAKEMRQSWRTQGSSNKDAIDISGIQTQYKQKKQTTMGVVNIQESQNQNDSMMASTAFDYQEPVVKMRPKEFNVFSSSVKSSQFDIKQITQRTEKKRGLETSRSIADKSDCPNQLSEPVVSRAEVFNKNYILKGGATMNQPYFQRSSIDQSSEPMEIGNQYVDMSRHPFSYMQQSSIRASTKRDSLYSIEESRTRTIKKRYSSAGQETHQSSEQLLDPVQKEIYIKQLAHDIAARAGVALPLDPRSQPGNYIEIFAGRVNKKKKKVQTGQNTGRQSTNGDWAASSDHSAQGRNERTKLESAGTNNKIQRVFLGELNQNQFKISKNLVKAETIEVEQQPQGIEKKSIYGKMKSKKFHFRKSSCPEDYHDHDSETMYGPPTNEKQVHARIQQPFRFRNKHSLSSSHSKHQLLGGQYAHRLDLKQVLPSIEQKSQPKFDKECDDEVIVSERQLPIDDMQLVFQHDQRQRKIIEKFDSKFDRTILKNKSSQENQLLQISSLMGKLSPYNFRDIQGSMRRPSAPSKVQFIDEGINQLEARWITIPIVSKEIENTIGEIEYFPVPSPCIIFFICNALQQLRGGKREGKNDLQIYASLSEKYPSPTCHDYHFDITKLPPIQNPFASDYQMSTERQPLSSHRSSSVHKSVNSTKPVYDGQALFLRQQLQVYQIVINNLNHQQFFKDGELRLGFYSLSGVQSLHYAFTFGQDPSKKSVKEQIADLGMQSPPQPEDNYPSIYVTKNSLFNNIGKLIDTELGQGNGAHSQQYSSFDTKQQKAMGDTFRTDNKSHAGDQRIQTSREQLSFQTGQQSLAQQGSPTMFDRQEESHNPGAQSPATIGFTTIGSQLEQSKLSPDFPIEEVEALLSPNQRGLSPSHKLDLPNSAQIQLENHGQSQSLAENNKSDRMPEVKEQQNYKVSYGLDPFEFIRPILDKRKKQYTEMRKEIQDQITKLCNMKPYERMKYEERLAQVNEENQNAFRDEHAKQKNVKMTDLIKQNVVDLVNPIRDHKSVARRSQMKARRNMAVRSMHAHLSLQDHKYNVFLQLRRSILQAIRANAEDAQLATMSKVKFVRRWLALIIHNKALQIQHGMWNKKRHDFYYYVAYLIAAKKLYRSYAVVIKKQGNDYKTRERNRIRYFNSFMSKAVLSRKYELKAKRLLLEFLRDSNRYRHQPFVKLRNTHRRIKNVQINMKEIIRMYRHIEQDMIDRVNNLADEFRQKIITHKSLEKKFGGLLHEMSTCIFRSSELLKIIIKDTILLKKFLRQVDSIRWVALYTDLGDGTCEKEGVTKILNHIRKFIYRDAKIYSEPDIKKYQTTFNNINKYLEEREQRKAEKQQKKDNKRSTKTSKFITSEEDKTVFSQEPDDKQVDIVSQQLQDAKPMTPEVPVITPEEAKKNLMRLKAANSVLQFSKKILGKEKCHGIQTEETERSQRERISEEEIYEQLKEIGIEPTELDSLVPPSFKCNPLQVDVEHLMFKTLVANKKQQMDQVKVDRTTGTLVSCDSPLLRSNAISPGNTFSIHDQESQEQGDSVSK